MCGNIINLQRSALETAPEEIERLATQAGYIEGVEDPAVFWLNSICVSTGVGVIQGMLNGFLNIDSGWDWIYQFPDRSQRGGPGACGAAMSVWHQTDTDCLTNPDCFFCADVARSITMKRNQG